MAHQQAAPAGIAPKQGEWSTGLCDCCAQPGGCGRCCYGTWCGCCFIGDNFVRMPYNAVLCGGSWAGACITYAGAQMLIGGGCIPQMMGRTFLRQKYGIAGSDAGDFCITWCCSGCAMCQEAREMDIREGVGKPIPIVAGQPGTVMTTVILPGTVMPPTQQTMAPPGAYPPGAYPPGAYPQPAYTTPGAHPPPPPEGYAQPVPQGYAQPAPQAYYPPPPAQPGYPAYPAPPADPNLKQ